MLSIIIPFYGNADKQLLNRCIKSIESQGLSADSYEVLVVDDEGKEVGGARNKGLQMAKGDFIIFIDADDFLFPDSLLPLIDLVKAQQPDVLSFDFQKIYSEADKQKVVSVINEVYESGAEYMNQHNFMGTVWRHIYRRSLLVDYKLYFDDNAFHEDESIVVMAYFYSNKTIITNRIVYAYFQHTTSILHNKDKAQREKRLKGFNQCLYQLQGFYDNNKNIAPTLQLVALQRRLHFLTIDYLFQMMRNRCSLADIRSRVKQLYQDGLLPLPPKAYTTKYKVARLFINTICRK